MADEVAPCISPRAAPHMGSSQPFVGSTLSGDRSHAARADAHSFAKSRFTRSPWAGALRSRNRRVGAPLARGTCGGELGYRNSLGGRDRLVLTGRLSAGLNAFPHAFPLEEWFHIYRCGQDRSPQGSAFEERRRMREHISDSSSASDMRRSPCSDLPASVRDAVVEYHSSGYSPRGRCLSVICFRAE
jgi:hypothetical protein